MNATEMQRRGEQAAKRRLEEAAPALLEAAMAALDYYNENGNGDAPTAIELRAAIAKAIGR